MADTKVAASEVASQNSDTASAKKEEKNTPVQGNGGKTEKKVKYNNPFSFTDPLQCKVVNSLMKEGKKTVAQKSHSRRKMNL